MPPSPPRHLPRWTPDDARSLCQLQCKALCCRGPAFLRLTPQEAAAFREHAATLGVPLTLSETPEGATLLFPDHPGEHCPMLDDRASACRIYPHRPLRCRDFPDKPTPGCALSED